MKNLHAFHTSKPIHPDAIVGVHAPYNPKTLGTEYSKEDALGIFG